jgi:hypothetical protein
VNVVKDAAVLALAIGAASYITSTAKISRRPRTWLAGQDTPLGRWTFDLVSCPLCTATWLAAIATALYRVRLLHAFPLTDYLVTSLAITSGAMVPVLVIKKAVEK